MTRIRAFPDFRCRVFLALWFRIASASPHYKVYSGDGSTEQGWPAVSDWLSFEQLWGLNMGVLNSSCSPLYGENNSPTEMAAIKAFIPEAAQYAGVPSSLFFTMMMQESDGCVRVGTTAAAVANPGLMQSNNGTGNCVDIFPCPDGMIKTMLMDGAGKGREYGLKQALELFNGTQKPQLFFLAARAYNAGPQGFSAHHLEQGIATRCYASDIANRLTGWTNRADTTCPFRLQTLPLPATKSTMSSNPTAATQEEPTFLYLRPNTSRPCSQYHLVQTGDTCDGVAQEYNTTFAQLRLWYPDIDSECTNLWLGYYYCMELR